MYHVFQNIFLVCVVRDLGTTFSASWLQLCHRTWRILVPNLSQHLSSVLLIRSLLLIVLISYRTQWQFLIGVELSNLILCLSRCFPINSYRTFRPPVTLSSSCNSICHISLIRRRIASLIIILCLSVKFYLIQRITRLLLIETFD